MLIVKSQQSAEDDVTLEELYSAFEQISSSREGGFMSDDKINIIAEKLNLITETVIRLEERTRKIEDLPTIDYVEGKLNVINEKMQRIEERVNRSPSKSEVELLVSNKHKENVRWQFGIGVAICGVIIGAMKYIFS
ncbi:hypothetical protein [Paenibacillus larvae]|uniref:Uncharacterized protein n=1 Tax=Paenibacillus larvae subsp. larvae TaxID=147375 RepID=A0A6C0QMH6_9BACL|nr:hypothetical protein [Paenibacillus larvae]QHZ49949.1 hypothetical protein ERICV_00768 [Paenibacillus larvae subsp. larvae]